MTWTHRLLFIGLASVFFWSCGAVTALPPLPTENGRSGLLIQGGNEPAVFAFALGPGQPAPTRASFTTDRVPSFGWLVFSCPLSELALSPGRQTLNQEPTDRPLLPESARSYTLSKGDWTETTLGPEIENVLRRLPLDVESFCPGSTRGVEIENRLLVGGERSDEVAFARILPVGRQALVLRALVDEQEREVDVLVGGSTVTITEEVLRIVGGQVHDVALDGPGMATTLRADSDELPFLEGTTDGQGATLWGPGQRARFNPGLRTARIIDEALLQGVQAIRGLGWSQAGAALALLVVDEEATPTDPPQEVQGEGRVRRLRLLGDVDERLESLAVIELPYAEPNPVRLSRLEDDRILVRSWGEDGLLVRFLEGGFTVEPRSIPGGALRQIEGRTYLLRERGPSFVYESGLFVALPEPPSWPFLDEVDRQLSLGGRPLFNQGGLIAERVDAQSVCPVADLGRSQWDAVSPWADRWAFLEPGDGREAGLFLVRSVDRLPTCGPQAMSDDG
ncbi:MAG: hypothetical protein AAF851_01075 [Myxococcota bacterium]